jgi:CubicO group peptidase (beta-lactamase class C family)
MWWVWDAPNSPGPLMGAYQATGAFGQFITVLPQLDMVIAHKADSTQDSSQGPKGRKRSVSLAEYDAILRMLIAAKCSGGRCQ